MEQSLHKLDKAAKQLMPFVDSGNLHILPCPTDDETAAYRCRCSFQIIKDDNGSFQYAIRRDGRPTMIYEFPVANRRIQSAMIDFLAVLNEMATAVAFTQHLTSVSFASSWGSLYNDCVITCHYDAAIKLPEQWLEEANNVLRNLQISQILGRSRRLVWSALPAEVSILRDQLVINHEVDGSTWTVQLAEKDRPLRGIVVEYEKPEGAFYHPNANAMLKALKWQLERISLIAQSFRHDRKPRLLEMYCGCGAHTVALAKSSLLESVVAIEFDQRLVDKCKRNVAINDLDSCVKVVSVDAGAWAKRNGGSSCDILLVDPPRQGLALSVCHMAIAASFQHILYISCGYEALVRDLELLSTAFEIVDCTVIDLFPTMEGVESLVHLQLIPSLSSAE
jgi:tRNA (uracil-5-)-methyltransferase